MKTNQEAVANFIRQAINACKEDYVFAEAKQSLYHALNLVESVCKKRNARENQSRYFAAEAQKKNEQWMEMLKKNLKMGDINDQRTDDQPPQW